MSIRDLLHDAADAFDARPGVDSARTDARILLAHAMGVSREDLIAATRQPSAEEARFVRDPLSPGALRASRSPISRAQRNSGAWISRSVPACWCPGPKPKTLIERRLAAFPDRDAALSIADLGAGSGALLVAALKEFPNARGTGFERSPEAFAYAEANLRASRFGGERQRSSPPTGTRRMAPSI